MFLVLLKCSLTLPAMVEQKFVLLLFFETVFLDGRVCVCVRACAHFIGKSPASASRVWGLQGQDYIPGLE